MWKRVTNVLSFCLLTAWNVPTFSLLVADRLYTSERKSPSHHILSKLKRCSHDEWLNLVFIFLTTCVSLERVPWKMWHLMKFCMPPLNFPNFFPSCFLDSLIFQTKVQNQRPSKLVRKKKKEILWQQQNFVIFFSFPNALFIRPFTEYLSTEIL